MVNVGMWFERFVIIVVSLHRAFLPSAGECSIPRSSTSEFWSAASACSSPASCLFIRLLPMIAMWEIKGVVGHGAHKMALSSDEDQEEVAVNA